MKISFNRQSKADLVFQARRLLRAPATILLQHTRSMEILVLLAGLAAGVYFIISLLFTDPKLPADANTPGVPTLAIETLNDLELWIEEQQGRLDQGLKLPTRPIFAVPSEAE